MGWSFTLTDPKGRTTIDLVLAEFPSIHDRVVASATAVEGGQNIMWLAVKNADDPTKVEALCILYKRRSYEFGTKGMSEPVGPCYYRIPDRVFNRLTDHQRQSDDAQEWWDRVKAERAKGGVRRRPKAGEVVRFDCARWRGVDTDCFEFVAKSVFIPRFADGRSSYRVQLRGWTTQDYAIVE